MRKESTVLLNKLQKLASNSKNLGTEDEEFVKNTFKKILECGDSYTMRDLENWFSSDIQKAEQKVLDRIMNIAHYQKSKFDAENKFRMVSDGEDCSCGSH